MIEKLTIYQHQYALDEARDKKINEIIDYINEKEQEEVNKETESQFCCKNVCKFKKDLIMLLREEGLR